MRSLIQYFVLPENRSMPSGGNLYNQFLLAALKNSGIKTSILHWNEYLLAMRNQQEGMYWIDTLYLKEWTNLAKRHSDEIFHGLIVHHLGSLYPPNNENTDRWFEQHEFQPLNKFDGFLATSEFTRNYLKQRGFSNKPILVIPPALCMTVGEKKRSGEKIVALMVANLVERKGIEEWLHALANQLRDEDDFSLKIIGTDEIEHRYAEKCKRFVNNHAQLKNKVSLMGKVAPEKIKNHYSNADIFISAAKMETFGMALQEAVAWKIPILAFDGGNAGNHVQPGINGEKFSDLNKMAAYFLEWIRTPQRFSAIQKTTQNHAPYNEYTWDDAAQLMTKQLKELWNEQSPML